QNSSPAYTTPPTSPLSFFPSLSLLRLLDCLKICEGVSLWSSDGTVHRRGRAFRSFSVRKRRTYDGQAGSTCEGRRCACPHGRYDVDRCLPCY
ncbi:unnamed protein product, partial [Ectocarpus sp. 12 AP-2014]